MYIRTKDGAIYDLENDDIVNIDGKYKECYVQEDTEDTCFKDIEVINQSETIEELCDQIVYNGYLYQNKITWDGSLVEDSFEELEAPITDEMIKEGIYGAVWCEFGLKYVAKLNSKGELELI